MNDANSTVNTILEAVAERVIGVAVGQVAAERVMAAEQVMGETVVAAEEAEEAEAAEEEISLPITQLLRS